MRILVLAFAIAGLFCGPATAGPKKPLRPGTVLTNVESLTSYRYIDANDEATGLRMDGFKIEYGRAGIRIRGNASDIVIRNGTLANRGVTKGGDLPVGIDIAGTAHDILIEGVTASNNRMVVIPGKYTNGDGFSNEQNVRRIIYRSTTSRDNSDGGYDLKSKETTLDRTTANSNGRNYRFWGTGTGSDVLSLDPHGADIWMAKDVYAVAWTIDGATFVRTKGGKEPVVYAEGRTGRLSLKRCTFVGFPDGTPMFKVRPNVTLDASCQPDAKGFVINTVLAGFDAGEVLPDKSPDGIIVLKTAATIARINAHAGTTLKRNDKLKPLGGTRYELVQ